MGDFQGLCLFTRGYQELEDHRELQLSKQVSTCWFPSRSGSSESVITVPKPHGIQEFKGCIGQKSVAIPQSFPWKAENYIVLHVQNQLTLQFGYVGFSIFVAEFSHSELTMNLPDPRSWSNQGVHTTCISDFLGYPPQLLISSLQSGRKKTNPCFIDCVSSMWVWFSKPNVPTSHMFVSKRTCFQIAGLNAQTIHHSHSSYIYIYICVCV